MLQNRPRPEELAAKKQLRADLGDLGEMVTCLDLVRLQETHGAPSYF